MLKTTTMINVLRIASRSIRTNAITRSAQAAAASNAEKLTIPVPEGSEKPPNPKLDGIVNQIASLNILEVSELSSLLKKKLNLPDAPMMPMGGFVQAAQGAPAQAAAEEEEAPKAIKSSYKVKMVKFDEKQKVALIKEIKNLFDGMNLVQAKKFVESIPTFVKEDVSKEEAEKLKESLSKIGAVIEIE